MESVDQYCSKSSEDKVEFIFRVYDIDGMSNACLDIQDVNKSTQERTVDLQATVALSWANWRVSCRCAWKRMGCSLATKNSMNWLKRSSKMPIQKAESASRTNSWKRNSKDIQDCWKICRSSNIRYLSVLFLEIQWHCLLLFDFSIDRWILPTVAPVEKAAKVPYKLTKAYWRNNMPFLTFMIWYSAMNMILFAAGALYHNKVTTLYSLARGAGKFSFKCSPSTKSQLNSSIWL